MSIEYYINVMSDIILSLGELQGKKITQEQKIKFVSLAYMTGVYDELDDIYIYLETEKKKDRSDEKLERVRMFLYHSGFKKYNEFGVKASSKDSKIVRSMGFSDYGVKWLNKYNIESEFKPTANDSTKCFSFLNENGEIVSIDRETAQNIVSILEETNIPLFHCIVKEAFKAYANENLNIFISEYEDKYLSELSVFENQKIR